MQSFVNECMTSLGAAGALLGDGALTLNECYTTQVHILIRIEIARIYDLLYSICSRKYNRIR